MNGVFKLISAVALSVSLMGSASAASATFDMSGDPGYLGYLGNVEAGRYGGAEDIGTDYIWNSSTSSWDENTNDALNSFIALPHWYNFTLDHASAIGDFLELGSDVSSFTATFYDSSGNEFVSITSTDPHAYQFTGVFAADASWWMKITGVASGDKSNYTVLLAPTAVPLPPAILLFGSALAGFGVLGRKKRQRISA